MMFIETEEGKALADALIILNGCLHLISVHETRRKYLLMRDIYDDSRRTPTEFIRRSVAHVLETFRIAANIPMSTMYIRDGYKEEKEKAAKA